MEEVVTETLTVHALVPRSLAELQLQCIPMVMEVQETSHLGTLITT
jgi:hypothetical protein